VRPASLDKDLFCFHLHHDNPYLILGPFKYERLHSNLEIGLFHDFASEDEMQAMKARARLSSPVPRAPSFLSLSLEIRATRCFVPWI
jgi:hypothetical protein